MAEDLTDYLLEYGVKVRYLHSEVDTLERIQIIRDLRLGEYDVLVGVNLLREGLDLPEVSLVAILDADKEGFLRGETSLVQTIGRAARNVNGRVLMYADRETDAMRAAMSETDRRRAIQLAYNEEHGITPETVRKGISEMTEFLAMEDRAPAPPAPRARRGVRRPGGAGADDRRARGGDAGRRRRPPLRGGGPDPRRAEGAAPRPRRDAGRRLMEQRRQPDHARRRRSRARARPSTRRSAGRRGAEPGDDVVFFQAGGMVVALWDRAQLAEDSGVEDGGGWGGVTLALQLALAGGGRRGDRGGARRPARRSPASRPRPSGAATRGVFVDPDGHPWEVAHNPRWTVA